MKKILFLVVTVVLSQSAFASMKIKLAYTPAGAATANVCKFSSVEIDKVKAAGAGHVCGGLLSATDKKEISLTELMGINSNVQYCYIGKDAAADKAGILELFNRWANFLSATDGGWTMSQASATDQAVVIKATKGAASFQMAVGLNCPQPDPK